MLLRSVEPENDAEPLFFLSHLPEGDAAIWTYLPNGPFENLASFHSMLTSAASSKDPCYFVLAALPGERPLGMASYLRITPEFGVIEIGYIWFGQPLRRTIAATEAIYLLARHAFDHLGYRRLDGNATRSMRRPEGPPSGSGSPSKESSANT